MNQILVTKNSSDDNYIFKDKSMKKKKWFHFQFSFSLIIVIVTIIFLIYSIYHLLQKEKSSTHLLSNYSIYQLYSSEKSNNNVTDLNELFGIIEIPNINLYYPIFSYLTEDLLKIAPCKFYGTSSKDNGNLCIAGHNYDNSLFFSNINSLKKKDEIYLYDNSNHKYSYLVEDIYEVKEDDLSPIFSYTTNEKLLTLITCNNFNNNRIIVRAKQKSP